MPPLKEHIPLSQHTTLHIGGVADYMVEVRTEQELECVARYAADTHLPLLVLGGGSNVLVSDEGYRGIVALMKIDGIAYEESGEKVVVTAGAGVGLDELIADTCARGLWGLENLSAIPGSVGATPVQNVGAYGVEVAQLISHVVAFNKKTFAKKIFSNDECAFLYRHSFFKTPEGREWIILSVTFTVQKKYSPKLTYADLKLLSDESSLTSQRVRETVIAIRSAKFPNWHEIGTAGSFFKNPIIPIEQYNQLKQQYSELPGYPEGTDMMKVSLGWILDKVCHLRGYREGSVGLYEAQALVLVNHGGATAEAVNTFVKNISEKIFLKTKIKIEREVLEI